MKAVFLRYKCRMCGDVFNDTQRQVSTFISTVEKVRLEHPVVYHVCEKHDNLSEVGVADFIGIREVR